LGAQCREAGRREVHDCQFDRERNAVQAPHDLANGGQVPFRRTAICSGAFGTLAKERLTDG
jgi:hypothetical protein